MKNLKNNKNCEQCNNIFISYIHENRRFCCLKCYHNSLEEGPKLICLFCNKKFKGHSKRKFCSLVCFNNNKLVLKNCKICNKNYKKKEGYKNNICSKDCYNKIIKEKPIKKILESRKEKKICKNCFIEFTRHISREAIFCSHECYNDFNRESVIFNFQDLTREAIYWIGFIFGDGSIDKTGRVQICLSVLDDGSSLDHLFRLSNFIYGKNKVNIYKTRAVLQFKNNNIEDVFSQYGIIPNKTYKSELILPSIHVNDFIRGFFDADGWSTLKKYKGKYKYLGIGMCSYKEDSLLKIKEYLNYGNVCKKKNQELYEYRFSSKKDCLSFYNNINGFPRLERKWKKIENYLNS